MENKLNYTLTCDITIVPDPDTDGMITSRKLTWFKDGVRSENVSTRHVANGTELTIIRAGNFVVGLSLFIIITRTSNSHCNYVRQSIIIPNHTVIK